MSEAFSHSKRFGQLNCFKLSLEEALAGLANDIVAVMAMKEGRVAAYFSIPGVKRAAAVGVSQRPLSRQRIQKGVVETEGARVFVKARCSGEGAAEGFGGGVASVEVSIKQRAALDE